ncbi:hypothetical protein [Streptomyces sediminimaris]|uniref:hypothetical protein n=1 Tax=Streptomyces sediminimaris TaxID=3383721 RepID=UPI00399B8C56
MDCGAIRRWGASLLAVLTASGLLAVAAPPAQAAPSSCPGHRVRTFAFSTGSVRVYKSGSYLCALTVARHPGARRSMMVSLQVRGFEPVTDKGRFTRHAGPVRAYVGHRKVRLRGSVGRGSYDSRGWKRF